MKFPEYRLISRTDERFTAFPRSQYPYQMTFDIEQIKSHGYAFMEQWRPLLRPVLEMPPQHELNMYFRYFALEWIKTIDLPIAYGRAVTQPPHASTRDDLRDTPGMREWVERPGDYKRAMDHYRPRVEAAMASMSIARFIFYSMSPLTEGRRPTGDNIAQFARIYGGEVIDIAHQIDCPPMYQADTINFLINQAASEIQIVGGVLNQMSVTPSMELIRTNGIFDSLVHDMHIRAPRLYDWRSGHIPF